jgi:hypothetical protein
MDMVQFAVSHQVPITLYHEGGTLVPSTSGHPAQLRAHTVRFQSATWGASRILLRPRPSVLTLRELSLVLFNSPIRRGDSFCPGAWRSTCAGSPCRGQPCCRSSRHERDASTSRSDSRRLHLLCAHSLLCLSQHVGLFSAALIQLSIHMRHTGTLMC